MELGHSLWFNKTLIHNINESFTNTFMQDFSLRLPNSETIILDEITNHDLFLTPKEISQLERLNEIDEIYKHYERFVMTVHVVGLASSVYCDDKKISFEIYENECSVKCEYWYKAKIEQTEDSELYKCIKNVVNDQTINEGDLIQAIGRIRSDLGRKAIRVYQLRIISKVEHEKFKILTHYLRENFYKKCPDVLKLSQNIISSQNKSFLSDASKALYKLIKDMRLSNFSVTSLIQLKECKDLYEYYQLKEKIIVQSISEETEGVQGNLELTFLNSKSISPLGYNSFEELVGSCLNHLIKLGWIMNINKNEKVYIDSVDNEMLKKDIINVVKQAEEDDHEVLGLGISTMRIFHFLKPKYDQKDLNITPQCVGYILKTDLSDNGIVIEGSESENWRPG